MGSVSICLNCLETGAQLCPVGTERGNQYDRYHEQISLCFSCIGALVLGDMAELHRRYRDKAEINRQSPWADDDDKRNARNTLTTDPVLHFRDPSEEPLHYCGRHQLEQEHQGHIWGVSYQLSSSGLAWCPGWYEDYNV